MAKEGRHYKFRKLEFWAQSGMICVVDERVDTKHDHHFEVVMVREMLLRIRAINAEIHHIKYADEREEHHRLVENMIKCCKDAQKQGRPDDPVAVESMLRARRRHMVFGSGSKSGQTQSVILHTASAADVPEGLVLPPMPSSPQRRSLVIDTAESTDTLLDTGRMRLITP